MRDPDHPKARRLIPVAARHRLEYAALLVAREMFRHLPPRLAVGVGGAFGALYARLRGPRTRDAATNLAIAFPDATTSERTRLLVDSFANLGRCIAEVFLLQGRHCDRLLAGLSVEGLEHYEAARKRSQSGGVIVLTAHFGSWELCGAAMAQSGYPLSVVHHDISNPHLERMVSAWRTGARVEEIRLGRAAMGVFRALSRGRLVAMLLDQDASRDEGVFAPLFGLAASTRSAPAAIAMNRSVPVLPVFVFREGKTARHVVRVFPALEIEADAESSAEPTPGALERNVARMNGAIEAAIRAAPDHWLWAHRRWKTRPSGDPPVYRRRSRETPLNRPRARTA